MERLYGFFILQTYVPSILIVILSWVSFWVNMDAVPARISLGVTTVLTMATQLSGSKVSIPKVSYPKAIDVWMSMCMMFVFLSLVEYAFVNALSRESESEKKKREKCEDEKIFADEKGNGHRITMAPASPPRKCLCNGREAAINLERAARVIFPVVFITFNIIYWSVYTQPINRSS
ncbi:hypothetical protein NP493_576g02004 [Ridgeia piscesae]|uniref:Neurotransmitter-gated ion-channel transmembrane domain-containing protein n=1 Tax=Ridgeia piscesae TaxID=27915 RepID=A0AAD9NRA3_RIDPI|nr:hypothetical protein NP493_576g02004 [Ridgeia piscesae]